MTFKDSASAERALKEPLKTIDGRVTEVGRLVLDLCLDSVWTLFWSSVVLSSFFFLLLCSRSLDFCLLFSVPLALSFF